MGNLLKVSIEIEILCTYKEYYLLLRFQKERSFSLVYREHSHLSQTFSNISGKRETKHIFLHQTYLEIFKFSSINFLTTTCDENLLINRFNYHSKAYWVHKKIKCDMGNFQTFSISAPCTNVLNMPKSWCVRNQHHAKHNCKKFRPCIVQKFATKWSQSLLIHSIQGSKWTIFLISNTIIFQPVR